MEAENLANSVPPALIIFSGDISQWEAYQESLFDDFKKTFLDKVIQFQGLPVSIKKQPVYKNKHFAFWHLISEGEKEADRIPDLRRCERLCWVSWVIENCDTHSEISFWENSRGSETHIVIWYEKENFVVVLAKRNGYFLLKTAYLADERRIRSFARERDDFRKKKP